MQNIGNILVDIFTENGFVMAFLIVGIMSLFSNFISAKVTRGRIHASAIAIFVGLVLAYIGGSISGGDKGLSDISAFAGIGILGGSSLRDFAIISTASDAKMSEVKKCGLMGFASLFVGILTAFVAGGVMAYAFGYTDAPSVATIAAGAVTFIVGPVTGAAVGASSEVIAISIAAGLVKSIANASHTASCQKNWSYNTSGGNDLRRTYGNYKRNICRSCGN